MDHVLHLEAGTASAYTGDYESFLRQRAERRLAQQRAFAKQSRALAAEEDFIRRNIAGQNSAQAKGRRRRLERVEPAEPAARRGRRDGAPPRRPTSAAATRCWWRSDVTRRHAPGGRCSTTSRPRSRAARWWAWSGRTGRGSRRCSAPSWASGRRTAGELRDARLGADRLLPPGPGAGAGRRRRCTTSSPTSARTGAADPSRATSAASASPATRCCGAPRRSRAASGRASRSR